MKRLVICYLSLCGYAALVGGHRGCSSGNIANSQCMTIAHCNKDIQGHLKSFGAGLADSSIKMRQNFSYQEQVRRKVLCISLYFYGLIISVADLGIGSRTDPGGSGPTPPLFLN